MVEEKLKWYIEHLSLDINLPMIKIGFLNRNWKIVLLFSQILRCNNTEDDENLHKCASCTIHALSLLFVHIL